MTLLIGPLEVESVRDLGTGVDTGTADGKPTLPWTPGDMMITFRLAGGDQPAVSPESSCLFTGISLDSITLLALFHPNRVDCYQTRGASEPQSARENDTTPSIRHSKHTSQAYHLNRDILDSGTLLTGGAELTLRASGTEPKLKYYLEVRDEDREVAEAAAEAGFQRHFIPTLFPRCSLIVYLYILAGSSSRAWSLVPFSA